MFYYNAMVMMMIMLVMQGVLLRCRCCADMTTMVMVMLMIDGTDTDTDSDSAVAAAAHIDDGTAKILMVMMMIVLVLLVALLRWGGVPQTRPQDVPPGSPVVTAALSMSHRCLLKLQAVYFSEYLCVFIHLYMQSLVTAALSMSLVYALLPFLCHTDVFSGCSLCLL